MKRAPALVLVFAGVLVVVGAAGLYEYATTPAVQLQHRDPHRAAMQGAGIKDVIDTIARPIAALPAPAVQGGSNAYAGAPPVPSPAPAPRHGLWIEAPDLDIALPVAAGDGSDRVPMWKALVYPGTARPGAPGNSYIYAHGYWEMFGPLLYARTGDVIKVHDYSDDSVRIFHISRVVGRTRATDTSWIHASSRIPMLTLQTCMDSGLGSDRFIVEAT